MAEGGKVAVGADDVVVSAQEQRELKRRIRDLERALRRKTMEVVSNMSTRYAYASALDTSLSSLSIAINAG